MLGIVSALMAEWLRRWTRNPMGSARAGSNPAQCVQAYFFSPWILSIYLCTTTINRGCGMVKGR